MGIQKESTQNSLVLAPVNFDDGPDCLVLGTDERSTLIDHCKFHRMGTIPSQGTYLELVRISEASRSGHVLEGDLVAAKPKIS